MRKQGVTELVEAMVKGRELGRLLRDMQMTAGEAMGVLQGEEGKADVAARRALARVQVTLLADRHGAAAMGKLCRLLGQAKRPDVQLKAALAVLAAMEAREEKPREKEEKEPAAEEQPVDQQEVGELLEVVAEVLGSRRRARFRAPDDSGPPEPKAAIAPPSARDGAAAT